MTSRRWLFLIIFLSLPVALIAWRELLTRRETSLSQFSARDQLAESELPSIDALQALPTPVVGAVITFNGVKPSIDRTKVVAPAAVRVENLAEEPIRLLFSSGAKMTVGASASAESTLFTPGIEKVTILRAGKVYVQEVVIEGEGDSISPEEER